MLYLEPLEQPRSNRHQAQLERHEVDLLIDQGTHLPPLEIKSGQTIIKDTFKGLEFWQKLAGETAGKAWLVYGGDSRQIRSDVTVLPWYEINSEQIVI